MSFRAKVSISEIFNTDEAIGEIGLSELDQLCFNQKNLEEIFNKFVLETKLFIKNYFNNIKGEIHT